MPCAVADTSWSTHELSHMPLVRRNVCFAQGSPQVGRQGVTLRDDPSGDPCGSQNDPRLGPTGEDVVGSAFLGCRCASEAGLINLLQGTSKRGRCRCAQIRTEQSEKKVERAPQSQQWNHRLCMTTYLRVWRMTIRRFQRWMGRRGGNSGAESTISLRRSQPSW
jgi:hypothetical protein